MKLTSKRHVDFKTFLVNKYHILDLLRKYMIVGLKLFTFKVTKSYRVMLSHDLHKLCVHATLLKKNTVLLLMAFGKRCRKIL